MRVIRFRVKSLCFWLLLFSSHSPTLPESAVCPAAAGTPRPCRCACSRTRPAWTVPHPSANAPRRRAGPARLPTLRRRSVARNGKWLRAANGCLDWCHASSFSFCSCHCCCCCPNPIVVSLACGCHSRCRCCCPHPGDGTARTVCAAVS